MLHKKLYIFLLGACVVLGISSCKKSLNYPATPGSMDFSALDKLLNDSVPVQFDGKCFALIHVDGKTVYSKGWGGYTPTTRQLIASCSKWLSAAVLMSLVDEGKIKLQDSIGKYMPIFTSYGKGKITIGQLFSHTSGFPSNSSQGYESYPLLSLSQAVDLIAKNVPLEYEPGTQFLYGGVSMHVAGRICEIVSGKSWADLLSQKILVPCGMAQTDYGISSNPGIAGGSRSTPEDYMKLLDMMMNKGVAANGNRVLSEAAVTAMEQSYTSNITVNYSPYPSILLSKGFYGIGNWRDITGPGDVLIENSSPGAFGSHPWINRSKKISGFIFTFIPVNGYLATLPTCVKARTIVRTVVP